MSAAELTLPPAGGQVTAAGGGLFSRLLISVLLMPALYQLVARDGDRLEV